MFQIRDRKKLVEKEVFVAPEPGQETLDFFAAQDCLLRELKTSPAAYVDYNRLSNTQKQAILASVDSDDVYFDTREGRTVVRAWPKGPSLFARMLTMGAKGHLLSKPLFS